MEFGYISVLVEMNPQCKMTPLISYFFLIGRVEGLSGDKMQKELNSREHSKRNKW